MTMSAKEHRGVAERFAAELRTKAALCDSLGCTHVEVPSMSRLTADEARALAAFLDRTGQLARAAQEDRAEAERLLADARTANDHAAEAAIACRTAMASARVTRERLERQALSWTYWIVVCAVLALLVDTLGTNLGVWP